MATLKPASADGDQLPTSAAAAFRRVLYLSYDGVTDPLGLSQVLPYLQGLAARGHQITLVSCEKPGRMARDGTEIAELCRRAGIDWQPVSYHKSPPILSGIYDVAAIKRRAARLHRHKRFDLVHCRSYMAAIAGDWLKRRFGVAFLFDIRGFWADERVERGFWPSGNPLFRVAYLYFKLLEKRFFRDADAVVTLTDCARREILSWPGERRPRGLLSVIPCCVDLDRFDPGSGRCRAVSRKRLGLDSEVPVLVYVGSLAHGYLTDEMFALFRAYRAGRTGSRFLIISGHDPGEIEFWAKRQGVDPSEMIITSATREEVPSLIAAGDVGVTFILPTFSAKASCPTKFGEMLAMGVPVIANAGVGDIADIIRDTHAGAVVEQFDEETLSAAICTAERAGETPEAIRAAAVQWFALNEGVERYDAIYRAIAS